ncbi:MAG: hypothetical protein ACXWP6_07780, partial [Ktedonobacterales bacterium]
PRRAAQHHDKFLPAPMTYGSLAGESTHGVGLRNATAVVRAIISGCGENRLALVGSLREDVM